MIQPNPPWFLDALSAALAFFMAFVSALGDLAGERL